MDKNFLLPKVQAKGISESYLSYKELFWILLGPFSLVACLLVLALRAPQESRYLSLVFLLAVPLCSWGYLRGLALSLTFLLGLIFLNGIPLPGKEWWFWGMVSSIILSLTSFTLSLDLFCESLEQDRENAGNQRHHLFDLDKRLKQVEADWKEDQETLKRKEQLLAKVIQEREQIFLDYNLQESLKNQIGLLKGQRESLIQELETEKQGHQEVCRQIQDLEEQKKVWDKQLQQAAEEKEELVKRLQFLEVSIDERKEKAPSQGDADLWRKSRKYEGLYHQLRHQFSQRNETLHATRKELYELQGEFEKLCRDQEEIKHDQLQELLKEQKHWLRDKKGEDVLRQEVETLRSLVSHLIHENNKSF